MNERTEPLLNSLWIGGDLPTVHIGCLLSAVKAGHRMRLFCYQRPSNLPGSIETADAGDILDPARIMRHRNSGSPSLATNYFRYKLQHAAAGPWIDTDVYVVRPLTSIDGYMMAWQDTQLIGSAVLGLPSGDLTRDLCNWASQTHPVPFWFNPVHRGWLQARRMIGVPLAAGDFRWGVYGPHLLTNSIKRHHLTRFARPASTYYPVPWRQAASLYEDGPDLFDTLHRQTQAIHLWHHASVSSASDIARGSFIDKAMRQVGIRLA
jgi:hypothetical protein